MQFPVCQLSLPARVKIQSFLYHELVWWKEAVYLELAKEPKEASWKRALRNLERK